jgi:hypothetical protein
MNNISFRLPRDFKNRRHGVLVETVYRDLLLSMFGSDWTKPGKWVVMYLCAKCIDFAPFCEFLLDFRNVPTVLLCGFFLLLSFGIKQVVRCGRNRLVIRRIQCECSYYPITLTIVLSEDFNIVYLVIYLWKQWTDLSYKPLID